MGYFVKPVILESPKRVVNEFRCLPIDLDVFIHLNNAKYATVGKILIFKLFIKKLFHFELFSQPN